MVKDSYEAILKRSPRDVEIWLEEEFPTKLPETIITMEDMEDAAKRLLELAGQYSYLCALSSWAKILKREAARSKNRHAHEDAVDIEESVLNCKAQILEQYQAVSRAVTIHQENNYELRMTRGVT